MPPSLPTLTSRTGVPLVILSAALVRPAVDMDTTCDGADVVRARAVPPTATAATATTTAMMTRPRVNKPDIPRTVPTLGRSLRPGERVPLTTENV